MRIAAGIILLGLGATGVVSSLLFLWSELRSPVVFHPLVALSVVVLFVGAGIAAGGISTIRRKAYWWPFMASICLVIVAIVATVLIVRAPAIPGDEPTPTERLLASSPFWGICGLPSLLALVFLVKRRADFRS